MRWTPIAGKLNRLEDLQSRWEVVAYLLAYFLIYFVSLSPFDLREFGHPMTN